MPGLGVPALRCVSWGCILQCEGEGRAAVIKRLWWLFLPLRILVYGVLLADLLLILFLMGMYRFLDDLLHPGRGPS